MVIIIIYHHVNGNNINNINNNNNNNNNVIFETLIRWELVVSNTIEETGRKYNSIDFQRYFRRVYQHYGSLDGYEILDDAMNFIKWADSLKNKDGTKRFTFGVTTNTPYRTIETVLPMMGNDYI